MEKNGEQGRLFQAIFSPLNFQKADKPWSDLLGPPEIDDLLNFLCTPGLDHDLNSIVDRYKKISIEKMRLIAPPYEENIVQKLVFPLRHAKSSFALGNYIGTIALCGMVSEMLAILLFEISGFTIQGRPLEVNEQKLTFGSSFENLGQERRINILCAYKLIDEKQKEAFDLIRTKRRKYLHFWSYEQNSLEQDAIKVFDSSVYLTSTIIGQELKEGKIVFNPRLIKYLEGKGVFKIEEDR